MGRRMYRGNSSSIGISSQELADIESAINSLKSNGLENLNGAIESTTDMFSALGVELGATPKRLLSVGTATIGSLLLTFHRRWRGKWKGCHLRKR